MVGPFHVFRFANSLLLPPKKNQKFRGLIFPCLFSIDKENLFWILTGTVEWADKRKP
jgi:hypothetical protein